MSNSFIYRDICQKVIRINDSPRFNNKANKVNQTKVYLVKHTIGNLPIYHYCVLFDKPVETRRQIHLCDFGPTRGMQISHVFENNIELTKMPSISLSIEDIKEFEKTLPQNYILLYRDCRHHTLDILNYCYPEP